MFPVLNNSSVQLIGKKQGYRYFGPEGRGTFLTGWSQVSAGETDRLRGHGGVYPRDLGHSSAPDIADVIPSISKHCRDPTPDYSEKGR